MDVKKIPLQAAKIRTLAIPTFCILVLFSACGMRVAAAVAAQEPAQPAPGQAESSSAKPSSGQSASKHADDFLLRGTVFTQEGLSLSGAELRIRRASDKKPKWETVTNSRGNFAVRVKMGADYEVVVRAKGFKDQSISVNAKSGERFKDLVFRMEHQKGKKS